MNPNQPLSQSANLLPINKLKKIIAQVFES